MLEGHRHASEVRTFDGIVDTRSQTIPRGFSLLFYGLVLWGAIFCAYYLLSGWSSEAEFQAKAKAAPSASVQPR